MCVLNILRWYAICKNVHGFYWYCRPVSVTASGVGVTPEDAAASER